MADGERERDSGPIYLAALLLAYYILMAILVPESHVVRVHADERAVLRTYLGRETATAIATRADLLYLRWFVASGVVNESYEIFLPSTSEQQRSRGLEQLGEREGFFAVAREKIDSFWALVRFSMQRLVAILVWLPLLLVLMMAAVWDGWMRRRIKMVGFEQTSAPIFGLARKLFIFGIFAPLFYVFAPIVIHPVIAPVWGCFMALALLIKVSNLQRI